MVKTNIQTFTGEVEILSNLHLGDGSYYLTANADASNVVQITGNVGATFFVGDGGFLSNIATTLSDIVDQGNVVSNVVQFSTDTGVTDYKGAGLVTDSNVGIQNTSPDHTLAIGDKIRIDDNTIEAQGQSVIEVDGRILATRFEGDGGLLSNIATTLESIVNQGNVSANVVKFSSNALIPDYTGVGLVTDSNVGIQNTDPVFNLSVGSNLHVDDEGSNVLVVHGNVAASNLNLGAFTVSPSHDLDQVCAEGNTVTRPVRFSNVITGISAASNIESAGTFISTDAERGIDVASNIDIGGRLKFDSNVFIDTLRVADIAANIVTYDSSTGELLDSSGTFMNKFAVVSEQPPSDFFANTTTVTNHGSYTLTTSNLATDSNTFNAFDGTANAWVSGGLEGGYIGGSNVFHEDNLTQLSNLHPTQFGDWLAIEFPYKTTLRHMKLTPLTAAQFPASANLYATNNDLTWTEVKYWNDVVPASDTAVQTITVDATEQFKKYALVATKAAGNSSNVAIQDWQLFTESFSIDGGKVAMAQQAATGGETVMDQSGPHSRDPTTPLLKKFPEIAFDASKLDGNDSTNTYVQAGYTVTASSQFSGYHPWEAFDEITGNGTQYWSGSTVKYATTGDYGFLSGNAVAPYLTTVSDTVYNGEWIQLELPHKLKLSYVTFFPRLTNRFPRQGVFAGSNDGTNWDAIHIFSELTTTIETDVRITTDSENNTTAYKYIRLVITHLNGNDYAGADNIKLYGYEEDPPAGDTSIDTTFTSIMNTPQTTGAKVYTDAKLSSDFTNRVVGPSVSNAHTTYVSAEKYWELSGNVESNVTIEANTFLSGDQPHAVSVWFNSSNLEANVSNTCVFSVSDQEHLNSENLDLQSNTWHNLTYAYQGEGGSRVTYLDGRKVAEDQAEDTFGEYPPFAMTGPSQGGYVVSVSGETISPARLGWKAWNDDTSDRWGVGGQLANDSRASAQNFVNPITDVLGVEHQGVWNTLEFPSKFKVSSLNVFSTGNTLNAQRRFRAGKLFGSNDNHNFYLLGEFESSSSTTDENTFAINSQVAYKYITFLVYKVWGTDDAVYIHRLKLYGHRENDLVRLPDPTRVLKYPHIAMTGPAQRGYVASASSNYNNLDKYAGWNAFDETVDDPDGWVSYPGSYGSGTPSTYSGVSQPDKLTGIDATSSGGDTSRDGSWLKIEVPHKLRLSQMKLFRRQSSQRIVEGFIYGSNDNSTFYQISNNLSQITNIGTYSNTDPLIIIPTDTTTPFKHFVVQVTRNDATSTHTNVGEWQLYGTEEATSIPIQIGGGNIDKVANFRVYDKFVGEDQALEIWDAQKDTFRGVKNSMTLHKGRLGIGTTEPEGRLVVADEPDPDAYGLQEFPPRGMGGNETLIEGHGVFKASASSRYPTDDYYAWKAFDHDWGRTLGSWTSASGTVSNTTGLPTSTAANFQGISGNWLQLKLPYKIQLKQFKIESRGSSSYVPEELPGSGIVYGSNDEVNWDVVHSFNNVDYGGTTGGIRPMFTVNSTVSYSIFRVLVTKNYLISGATWTSIGEWRLFGYREQVTKQSVLHDGQLTLTKNLTVPRIGPPLDADDTPRRDRLVVEYNTSTNPTFEGAVRDTSGRGLDGMFYGGASYNATKKALVFDGTDDYIFVGNLNNPAGAWAHSYSFWVNFDGTSDEMLVQFGKEGASKSSSLRLNSSTELIWFFNSYSTTYTCSISTAATTWYHISAVYDGNLGMSVYINGAPLAVASSTLTTPANYDANEPLYIGTRVSKLNWLDGSISNFKLYDCALTAEEVKTLYDMGQCDEGHHVVNFSKTRVGIGLGDGEAPTYTLDVRGQIRSQGSLVTSFTGQHKCVPEEPVEKGLIVSAKKNQYVKLNGSLDTGKSAITIDESLPIVSLSNVVQDKACFGVVSSTEEANTVYRVETTNGGVISYIPKTLGDNRAIVNSVGEGAIWVVNTNGSLESGDYITTSNVAGYGQKQEDDVLHNYTVAKITMDCDFTGSNVAVQTIKREETGLRTITEDVWNDLIDYDRSSNTETQYSNTLVPSAYSGQSGYTPREVTTIVDYTDGSNLISIAEWSNLESNIQNTYQSNTFTEIADYTKFISLDEWSNLTVDVQNTYSEAEITTYYQIKRGENVLDENGQLQFEDKTGATEAPYERRFLDASGAQTDEANAVHIAAFVGCTYHCG
jgi:hypothetical protein